MEVRFLHTSDWQLGMTRHFLGPEAQARYTDDQFATVRRMLRLATERGAGFVVVAGDVFDHLLPDRRIVARAVDALAEAEVPVYLLPGNHDADNPAALWANSDVLDRLPPLVTVLRDSEPRPVPGLPVEVVGVPLRTRKPDHDLVAEVLGGLGAPPAGTARVLVAHGQVGGVAFGGPAEPVVIDPGTVDAAVADGRVSYVALGDRHSLTPVGATGAVWYSGAPLATAYREDAPNQVLVVGLVDGRVTTDPVTVGTWRFLVHEVDLTGADGVDALEAFLGALDDKERTVVKLGLTGTVGLADRARLDRVLDRAADLLGGLEVSDRRSELVVVADGDDVAGLDLSGFARAALDDLAGQAAGGGPTAPTARDALLLLHRLVARTR